MANKKIGRNLKNKQKPKRKKILLKAAAKKRRRRHEHIGIRYKRPLLKALAHIDEDKKKHRWGINEAHGVQQVIQSPKGWRFKSHSRHSAVNDLRCGCQQSLYLCRSVWVNREMRGRCEVQTIYRWLWCGNWQHTFAPIASHKTGSASLIGPSEHVGCLSWTSVDTHIEKQEDSENVSWRFLRVQQYLSWCAYAGKWDSHICTKVRGGCWRHC